MCETANALRVWRVLTCVRASDHAISMNGMLRVFDVDVATPGAVRYTTQATAKTKKRAADAGEEKERVTSVERAVFVPPDVVFVFVLTANRGKEFKVPQSYKRGDHVLQPRYMNEAEQHVATRVQQQKVWAQYDE